MATVAADIGEEPALGTEENPLVHPVTGERIVFRRRGRDTAGEFLEMNLYLAPGGFIPLPHIHPRVAAHPSQAGGALRDQRHRSDVPCWWSRAAVQGG